MAIVPRKIHKVIIVDGGETPVLPEGMQKSVDTWRNMNPGYSMKLYNLNDCRNYIQQHGDPEDLMYFDKLKPYSYKSDFFRFFVLLTEGGWYSDMRQVCMLPIDELNNTSHEFYTSQDCPPNQLCMYTAFIGSIPGHPILKKTLDILKWNIDNKHYGLDCLYPTGPGAFMSGSIDYVRRHSVRCMIGRHIQDRDGSEYVAMGKQVVLKCKYNNARGADFSDVKGGNDYGKMWREWDIYT
jgi:hypothetical protein